MKELLSLPSLDLVLQVVSKELKVHGYYKEKGNVIRLVSKYVAEIEMHKSGDILQVQVSSYGKVEDMKLSAQTEVDLRGCFGLLLSSLS